MTAEEIYLKLKEELTAENESSSSPERIFIKNDGQTICTIGMNRSHEIIFVEFKPNPKDLSSVEREAFVHPHPVEMLHDAGWRQAQLTQWEEAEKLLQIIDRSYKKKKVKSDETVPAAMLRKRAAQRAAAMRAGSAVRNQPRAETSKTAKEEAAQPKRKVEKQSEGRIRKGRPAEKRAAKPAKAAKASRPAKAARKAAAKKAGPKQKAARSTPKAKSKAKSAPKVKVRKPAAKAARKKR